MVHARQATAFADGLIQRIAGRGRAEGFAVSGPEALDRFLVEQRFGRREQREAVDLGNGALVSRIETADAFDLVAEKIEAECVRHSRREQIDKTAAHREIAGIGDGFAADVTIGREQRGQRIAVDPFAGRKSCGERTEAERGQRALGHGVDGGDKQLRFAGFGLQRRERGHAFGCHPQAGRGTVVGQAIPCRKVQDFELGREPCRGIRHCAHCSIVRSNQHGARVGRTRQVRHQRGQETVGYARERQRHVR